MGAGIESGVKDQSPRSIRDGSTRGIRQFCAPLERIVFKKDKYTGSKRAVFFFLSTRHHCRLVKGRTDTGDDFKGPCPMRERRETKKRNGRRRMRNDAIDRPWKYNPSSICRPNPLRGSFALQFLNELAVEVFLPSEVAAIYEIWFCDNNFRHWFALSDNSDSARGTLGI